MKSLSGDVGIVGIYMKGLRHLKSVLLVPILKHILKFFAQVTKVRITRLVVRVFRVLERRRSGFWFDVAEFRMDAKY